eukprot:4597175-Pleurochrysis_carterae.AAC.1
MKKNVTSLLPWLLAKVRARGLQLLTTRMRLIELGAALRLSARQTPVRTNECFCVNLDRATDHFIFFTRVLYFF